MIERFKQELKCSFRSLLKTPVFCVTAVLTLALGCAATSTIFSILRATLLKPLPYAAPERIVTVSASNPSHNIIGIGISPGDYADLKSSIAAFSDTAYSTDQTYTLTGTGDPETLIGYQFSSNCLSLLGVKPKLGRNFSPDEENSEAKVALLSFPLWMRRFGGDQNVIGRTITLEGALYTIIGVMPNDFNYPSPNVELWTPLRLDAGAGNVRNIRFLHIVARLPQGITLQQAQTQMAALSQRLQQSYPQTDAGWKLDVHSIRDAYVGDIRTPLLVLQIGALLLLLIACANLSSLLLARAIAQQKQFAVRMALGSKRSVVFTTVASEALLLSVGGAAVGVVLAVWALSVLPGLVPSNILNLAIPSLRDVPLNWWSMMLSVSACFLVSCLMGVVPLWRNLTSACVLQSLGEGGRGASRSVSRNLLRSGLIVAEVALSLMLLVGSGLMIRSMLRLQDRNLGIETENLLTMRIVVPTNRYSDTASISRFLDQVVPRIAAVPGVKEVGVTNVLPLSGMGARRSFRLETDSQVTSEQQQADFRVVTPELFRALGIPLIKGRFFGQHDGGDGPAVILINESLARLFPRGVDPIGKRIVTPDLGRPEPKEIVGIVGDVRYEGLAAEPQPTIYRPFAQTYWPILSFVVRTSSDPLASSRAVTAAIWQSDNGLPVNATSTMERLASESLALRNLAMIILCVFAGAGVLLAALGLYGLISYDVSQRCHEIGIRSALGAQRRDIVWLVVRHALRLVLAGQVLGIVVSLLMTKALAAVLFGVHPTDFVTFFSVCFLIAAVSAAACLFPSLRAVRIDPALALHNE